MPKNVQLCTVKFVGRAMYPNCWCVGTYEDNLMLITLVYEVEYPDREVKEYLGKIIAENIYSQLDCNSLTLSMILQVMTRK